MAFQTKAFDLTTAEKHVALGQIRSLVLGAGALLARANNSLVPSSHDYGEALSMINKALFMATDPDACDPLLAPLATCYLYKGHILLALCHVDDARAAYEKAAASESLNITGFAEAGISSRDEAQRLLNEWDDTLEDAMTLQSKVSVLSNMRGFVAGMPGDVTTELGPDGIRLQVISRPGPAKRPHLRRVKNFDELLYIPGKTPQHLSSLNNC
ncbi:hypothetical protein F5Y03DRAFT_390243 [Xylaria venustula]|nr:hypothetical protein F5Y03DRAFT_390243 [Xylaria venustula]